MLGAVLLAVLPTVMTGPAASAADGPAGPSSTGTPSAGALPIVASTFLDPRATLRWDPQRWDDELTAMRAAGLRSIALQASADLVDGRLVTYYPSSVAGAQQATLGSGAPADVVGTLLATAAAHGMRVWLGLYRDARGERFAPDDSIGTVLTQDADTTLALARDLEQRYAADRSTIAGWYLPAEVNTNYTEQPARGAVQTYFRRVTRALHGMSTSTSTSTVAPGRRVMISPYFNADAGVSAATWQWFWAQTLVIAPLDVVALQDGAGDIPGRPRTRAELDSTLGTWFAATKAGIVAAGAATRLWSNLDLYEFTGAAAPVGAVAADARAVAPYVSSYTGFSFTGQYSPWTLGTDAYARVFGRWNTTGVLPEGRPTSPADVRVTRDTDQLTVSWSPSVSTSGAPIAYYRIYGAAGEYLTTVWGTSTALTTTASCIGVRAFDVAGNASARTTACAT